MSLEYLSVLEKNNYTFRLSNLNKGTVRGIIVNDIAIGFGNDFSTAREMIENAADAVGGSIGGAAKSILAAKDAYAAIKNVTGKSQISQLETRLVWQGSQVPVFSIDFFFLNTDSASLKEDPLEKIKILQRAVLPSGKEGDFLTSPLGYRATGTGTMILEIGSWLRIPNLIMDSMSFVASKEVVSNGKPLFVKGSFTVRPFEAITLKDFLGYYRVAKG